MVKNKKIILTIILILLIIFSSLTILSAYLRNNKGENPNHDFYYANYLWFYDDNKELISKYKCLSSECGFAKSSIDDSKYNINYNGNYVFIEDDNSIYLYSILTGTTLTSYKMVKNYNTNLPNNLLILENNNNLWGVITLNDNLKSIIPFEYEFIGLKNNLDTTKFIVLKDNNWYLLDESLNKLTSDFTDPIVDYNMDYIITNNQNNIKIYDYNGNEYLDNQIIQNYVLDNDYIGVVIDNYLYLYSNLNSIYIANIPLNNSNSKIELTRDSSSLNIIIDNEIVRSIAIN